MILSDKDEIRLKAQTGEDTDNVFSSIENDITAHATGLSETETIEYELGKYTIYVQVNQQNEFIGINKIEVKKNFYNYKTLLNRISVDVEEYYKDEEE